MSGLAGLLGLDGRPADREMVERMRRPIEHRGILHDASQISGSFGFAGPTASSSRFYSFSLSPSVRIVADARIDNRDELLAALGIRDVGEPVDDAALILAAWAAWGVACPEHLEGDFVFVIHDPDRRLLFAARDRIGARPFYYHLSPDRFAFASEIKSLLALPGVSAEPNETRIGEFLAAAFQDTTGTFYREIHRLSPAHTITIVNGTARTERYWSLDPERALPPMTDEEYAEQFRAHLTEGVRVRLPSAEPAGSLLSGGLDSSALCGVARDLFLRDGRRDRLHTFSAVFDDLPECDERRWIEQVVAMGGFEPHFVRADTISPLDPRALRNQDEPFFSPNLAVHAALYDAAAGAGVRVLLDGYDGDTTISHGNAYLTELARAGRWAQVARELRGLTAISARSAVRAFRKQVVKPLLPRPMVSVWSTLSGRKESASPEPVIDPGFARRIALSDRLASLAMDRSDPPATARERHWRRLTSGMIPTTLETLDRAAAAAGVEPRYPFFDRRLVEYCLALPPEQKMSDGWTRIIARRALAGLLPEAIVWRRDKSDPSASFRRGLLRFEAERIERAVAGELIAPYVDRRRLREIHSRYRVGGTAGLLSLWKVTMLDLWLRRGSDERGGGREG